MNLPPLREYQAQAHRDTLRLLADLRSEGQTERVLNVAPCGAGKTRLGLEHVAEHTRELRPALWIAPGKDLVRQPVERLLAEGWQDVAWISDGRRQGREDARLTVATVQGLEALAAAGRPLPEADLLVIDEARSCATPGRVALLDRWPAAVRIGYDASPIGPGGVGLGMLFRRLIVVAQPGELIAAGYLAPYVVRAPKAHQPELAADPVVAWRNCTRPGGETTFAYCRDVKHAQEMAEAFRRAGVRAEHLEGKHSTAHRARVLLDFLEGRITVLSSAIMLRQGVDIPPASVVLVARAALSLSLWVQMTGRGGRPKERCLVIDLHGAVHLHGHPADPRAWSLEGEAVRAIEGLPPCRQCSACLAWWPGDGGCCPAPDCGAPLLAAPRAPVRVKATELVEVFAAQSGDERAAALVRYTEAAYRSAVARGLKDKDLTRACQSAAFKWSALYHERPPFAEVARIVRGLSMGARQQTIRGVE